MEITETKISDHDDVAEFIAGFDRSEKGFQRVLNRQKIKQIVKPWATLMKEFRGDGF